MFYLEIFSSILCAFLPRVICLIPSDVFDDPQLFVLFYFGVMFDGESSSSKSCVLDRVSVGPHILYHD